MMDRTYLAGRMSKKPASRRKVRVKNLSKPKAPVAPAVARGGETCLVVGVGASAGGLEAFTTLLKNLPEDTGMAFVLVQHLDPKHASQLPAILSRPTRMPVTEVKDGMAVEPNHVYIIPSNTSMGISNGALHLTPRKESGGTHMPVDYFLQSLAASHESRAIGVILSGTASDGTIGLKAIKEGGGITFAEDEESARYPGMPRSAIAAGCVDFVLPPEEIARELARIAAHPFVKTAPQLQAAETEGETRDGLRKIFALLCKTTGVDFSQYRKSTVNRRIQRRLILNKLDDVDAYVEFIREKPGEIDELYQDILIHVTGFFREPETFKILEKTIFPRLVGNRSLPTAPIRVWLPGCSTGEEAYSIAISLVEFLKGKSLEIPIQIFGTDVSERVIEKARQGIYAENIEAEVSPERLRRFFTKVELGYQINKSIREMCVFARQNVIKDPPFSKLDLISCRNLLIYLEPALQKKLMPVFHYALKPDGFLLLGSAETTGGFDELFRMADQKSKIYQRKPGTARFTFDPGLLSHVPEKVQYREKPALLAAETWSRLDILKEADRMMISRYCPPSVIVDENMEIVQFRGHINHFLQPAAGEASLNLYKMTGEPLQMELRAAIQRAKQGNTAIRKEGLEIKFHDEPRTINIDVIPLAAPALRERCFIILFEEVPPSPQPLAPEKIADRKDHRVAHLEQELAAMKEHLQAVVEEQEATNEELRSANEEIQSANEELQSTNEELETAKEELQSTNEELTTVNDELRHTNLELTDANNDLGNLLRSVNLPIVMLDRDFCIRRFTPAARKTFKLLPGDVGRPITDTRADIEVPDLEHWLQDVIDSLGTKEHEVQDKRGRWYLLQLRPYETADNKIAGLVMVLFDIDASKRFTQLATDGANYANAIVQTVREPLLILNGDLRVKTATRGFYRKFRMKPKETEGKFFHKLGHGQWNIPKLRELLEEILPKNSQVHDFEIEHDFPQIGRRKLLINAHRVLREGANEQLILLSIEEIKK